MAVKAGKLIQDGTVTWIVDDVRDGARVGDIILRSTLRDGFVKANGATVKASEYPRLLAWVQGAGMTVTAEKYAQDCSKYVYDEATDKLTLPNAMGRVLQGGETVKSVGAGLPNITGSLNNDIPNGHSLFDAHLIEGGALYVKTKPSRAGIPASTSVSNWSDSIDFDASKSNAIYGRSETVQPPALAMIAQIKY